MCKEALCFLEGTAGLVKTAVRSYSFNNTTTKVFHDRNKTLHFAVAGSVHVCVCV